ncbi:Variant-specific surface protein [Giardia duodenalis]|uniref:Variant-specific surface protein n=2 Tax=Giardia intestinalis TaxID=5741 RepID=V6TN01_GIAIN|nr:Variant-specific surface protein [Giardia intestinalis]
MCMWICNKSETLPTCRRTVLLQPVFFIILIRRTISVALYFQKIAMFFKILWTAYILQSILAACTDTTQGQTGNCKTGKCDVSLGAANNYCSQCSATADYLINGECVANNGESACTKQDSPDGTCKSCAANYFLHKGGCYKVNQAPGNLVCADTAGSTTVVGTCDACKDGYFKNLEPAATKQSCISCSETSNVDGVKGVVDCTICKPPASAGTSTPTTAVCTKCDTTKYLKKADDGTTTCEEKAQCDTGTNKFVAIDDSANGNKCVSCGDSSQGGVAGCDTCGYDAQSKKIRCTKCTSNYLKTAADRTTTCEADCGDGYFGHTDDNQKKTCQSCATASGLNPSVTGIEGCTSCTYTSSTLKCTACGEGKKPNKEGTECFDCGISGCTYCSGTGKCEECGSGFSLEGEACISTGGVNLSTGAIAGISVAAVVVVGGLVGFLCWWFICRGKA